MPNVSRVLGKFIGSPGSIKDPMERKRFFSFRKNALILCAVVIALTAIGCGNDETKDWLTSTCQSIGVCDEPIADPVVVEILCDASLGSSCTAETLEATLDNFLPAAAKAPGSVIRVWALGTTFGDTVMVAAETFSVPQKNGKKAFKNHQSQFINNAKKYLLAESEPYFDKPANKRSPIAEAISKVALASEASVNKKRVIVCITDAREVSSTADFECKAIPKTEAFKKALHQNGLLLPDSLARTKVYFVGVIAGPVGGRDCAVTVERELQIRKLWTEALSAASAESVTFSTNVEPIIEKEERHAR